MQDLHVVVIKPGDMFALFFLLRVYFCYSAVCTQISVIIIILIIVVIITDVL